MKDLPLFTSLLAALVITFAAASAEARNKKAEPAAPLTEAGEAHLADFNSRMEALKTELLKALPTISKTKMAAFNNARDAESAADASLKEVQKGQAEIKKGHGLVAHAKGKWIGGAKKAISAAKEELKAAKSAEAKKVAAEKLAEAEKGLEAGEAALVERQAGLDAALKKYANLEDDLKKAQSALDQAKANTLQAVKDLGISNALSSDKLDGKLAAYMIMSHAKPHGLATYAQQGTKHRAMIDQLLADGPLCVEIAVADGASGGNYGKAMEILDAILKTSPKAGNDDTLHKLAMAVALEHATPIKQRSAVADTDAPEFVDPLKRYLAYEKAFLGKELDPCFDDLSVWDLRMVVDGEEPDHIAAWGRQMLANYRPDQISTPDERWRYVEIVRSDIRYGSQDNKFDQDELQFFQNILKNGGICGRRAFIGRFILRSFGVPTTARPQPGHAALAHHTSDGWVICLGGGWGAGSTKHGYKKDLDFLASTQGRATGEAFKQVMRAHWIGLLHGEERHYGFLSHRNEIPFWNTVALNTQRDLIEKSKAKTLAAVGEDIGEANETKEKVEIIKVELSEDDKKVQLAKDGSITIPAAATSKPTKSTGKIIFMPSNQGGLQMHYSRNGNGQPFEYTFDATKAGKYALTAKVVTPSWKQQLIISANGAEPVELELPHTVGMWETTAPVTIQLKAGQNVLNFQHQTDGYAKGFSIHHFRLTPLE